MSTQAAQEAEKFRKELFRLEANSQDAARSVGTYLVSAINQTIEKFREGTREGKSFYRTIFEEQLKVLGLSASESDGSRAQRIATVTKLLDDQTLPVERRLRLEKQLADLQTKQAATVTRSYRPSENYGDQYLPALPDTRPPAKPKGASGTAQSEAERYLEGLQKQTEAVQSLTIYEKALAEVQSGRLKGLTPALESAILAQAKQLDQAKKVKEFRDAEVEGTTKTAKAQLAQLDAIEKGNDALRKEIDLLGLDAEGKTAVELQSVRVARAEKEATLAKLEATGVAEQQLQVLQAEIAALTEREALLNQKGEKQADVAADAAAKKAGDSYRDTLSDSIAEGLLDGFRRGQSFSDIYINELKGQFAKTVLSPLIKPVVDQSNKAIADLFSGAANAFNSLFTSYSYNGGVGTTNAAGISGGRAVGGGVSARNAYVVGEHGPEILKMGSRGGTVTPNPITAREGSRQVTNNVYNNGGGQVQTQANDTGGLDVFIEAAAQRGRQLVTGDFASGTGQSAIAAKQRFGLGAGNLAKRG